MDPINQHMKDKALQTEGISDLCSHSFLGKSGIHWIRMAEPGYFLHLLWQVDVVKWGGKKIKYSDFRNFADIFWWRKGGGILNKNRSFYFGSNCYLCVLLDIFNYTWCFLFCSDLLLRHALSVAFASYPQHMLSWVSFCWINAYCFRAAQFTHTKSHHDLL